MKTKFSNFAQVSMVLILLYFALPAMAPGAREKMSNFLPKASQQQVTVIVATPTLAPNAPTSAPMATAVPEVVIVVATPTAPPVVEVAPAQPAAAPDTTSPRAGMSPSGGGWLMHPAAVNIQVAKYSGVIRYCFEGDWNESQRQAVGEGFRRWSAAGVGVAFVESVTGQCDTVVSWGSLGADAGRASVGPGSVVIDYYWTNGGGCSLAAVAQHEVGHNLGLDDRPGSAGIMGNADCYNEVADSDEVQAVMKLWGGGQGR